MPVMKPAKFVLLLTLSTISIAQTPTEPNSPKKSSTPPASASTTPALSTADKLALTDCERRKQDARSQFEKAQSDELQIEREFEQSHPGFRVNPATFAIEPIAGAHK